MNHWYDWVFWAFFGVGILFILGVWMWMLVTGIRDRRRWRRGAAPASGARASAAPSTALRAGSAAAATHETWGVGSADTSTGFDTSSVSSSDSSSSDTGGGDSGGGFESGGGESGGGGSSGGWND